MNMTIYLYRWKIKPGMEAQFEANWTAVTKAIRQQCGSYGSRLHIAANGEYVGYAQWPDIATRESCELDSSSLESRTLMRAAVELSYPDEKFKVKNDLLIAQ